LATSETLRQAADYQGLVIKYINGAPIRLSDVALVTDSTENRYSAGFHNDKDAVILLVSRRTGANIVETIDAIYQQLPLLQALTPAGADLAVVMDRSPVIRATLAEAQISLLIAAVLVVLVVWAFLGSFRSALIPSLTIPISLIGAFTAISNFSLKQMMGRNTGTKSSGPRFGDRLERRWDDRNNQ
jgi:multidrug efflux pump